MGARLTAEINEIIVDLSPPSETIGLMTAAELTQIISVAANRAALAGWVLGMQSAVNAMKKEHKILTEQIKELQAELNLMERIK